MVTTHSLISNLRTILDLVAKGFTSAEAVVFHLHNRSHSCSGWSSVIK